MIANPTNSKRGNQHIALGDIPPHEQESAQSQHAGTWRWPGEADEKNTFQTCGGGIRFTGSHTQGNARRRVWAGHSPGKECRSRRVPY